jgi:hypothetical protein
MDSSLITHHSSLAFLTSLAVPNLFWAGAALTASPIIIHLLNRRRFKTLEWAAMEFLLESLKTNRRRLQAEELILLLMRMLMLCLLGLAVAKPMIEAASAAGAGDSPADRVDHVIVVDDSLSMGQRIGGRACFEDAKQTAADLLKLIGARSMDSVSVLRVSRFDVPPEPPPAAKPTPKPGEKPAEPAAPPPAASAKAGAAAQALPEYVPDVQIRHIDKPEDAAEIARVIEGFPLSDSASRLDLAVRAARELASKGQNPNKAVHVISDFRERDVGRGPGSGGEALREAIKTLDMGKAKVVLHDVGRPERGNIAVTALEFVSPTVVAKVAARLKVTVRNFGEFGVRGVRLVVSDGVSPLEERTIGAELEAFNANSAGGGKDEAVEFFDIPLEAGGRTITAEAKLPGESAAARDTLAADNRAHIAVEVRDALRVLIVRDPPPETARPGDDRTTFFLARAIDDARRLSKRRLTGATVDERTVPVTGDPRGRLDFAAYNLVIFANVASLEDRTSRGDRERIVRDLETYLKAGGHAIFFCGDRVDARSYNDLLFRNGEGPFPVKLDREYKESGRFYRLVAVDGAHPVFREFKDGPLTPLLQQLVRTYTFWALGEKPGPAVRVPVVFDDAVGSPAWVERPVGEGRVLAFLSGSDDAWNNWGKDLSFQMVIARMLEEYSRGGRAVEHARVGAPLEADVPDAVADREVRVFGPPDASSAKKDLVEWGRVRAVARDGRTFVRVGFPVTDAEGAKRDARAGFFRLDWSEHVGRLAGSGSGPARGAATPASALFARTPDVTEARLGKPEKLMETFADLKDKDGGPLVEPGTRTAEGAALSPAAGAAGDGAAATLNIGLPDSAKAGPTKKETVPDLELFYWLMGGLLALMLAEQFAAYKFSHHE